MLLTTRVDMVKTYKRKTTTKYSEKDLVAAVKAVKEDGVKLLVAARKFNVSRSNFFDHVKDLHPKIGAGTPTILMPHEEKEIVVILQVLQNIGFGLTKDLVGIVIRYYLHAAFATQPLL